MSNGKRSYDLIEEYIAQFPDDIQEKLHELRKVIRDTVPGVKEKISYQMPTFYRNGNLLHFAAYKNHIGFYPTPSAIQFFKNELSTYKTSKGAVQFPIDKPLPYGLIREIVAFRMKEDIEESRNKKRI